MRAALRAEVLLFDVFGTVVDVVGPLGAYCQGPGEQSGLPGNWEALAQEWKTRTHDVLRIRTSFIERPSEDRGPAGDGDFVARNFLDLGGQLAPPDSSTSPDLTH
jgi:hypothetical protein